MTRTIDTAVVADVAIIADGAAIVEHERTVSTLTCDICGATEVADGIVAHLVFDHDHRHGEDV